METMDRLGHLIAWQEKQRDILVQQQQQEIRNLEQIKLRRSVPEVNMQLENRSSKHTLSSLVALGHGDKNRDTAKWGPESEDSDDGTAVLFSGAVHLEGRSTASGVSKIDQKLTKPDELALGLSNYSERVRRTMGDERPIKPGVDELHVTSFEALLESSLHSIEKVRVKVHDQPKTLKPFLRCGEGTARFGLNRCRGRFKKKKILQMDSCGQRPFKLRNKTVVDGCGGVGWDGAVGSDGVDDMGVGEGRRVGGGGRVGDGDGGIGGDGGVGDVGEGGGVADVGGGGGVADVGRVGGMTSRNMVRKVARAAPEEEKFDVDRREVLPCVSTPAMVRCSSEDSFIVRRDTRLELEHEELIEFEMLEKAADTMFSSQLTLFQDCQSSPVSLKYPPHDHRPADISQDHQPTDNPFDARPVTSVLKMPPRASADSRRELLVDTRSYGTKPMTENISERARLRQSSVEEDYSDVSDGDDNLDETLKGSPSLVRGMEFDDNEAWESFSHGSPRMNESTCRSDSQNSSPSAFNRVTVLKLPVREDLFEEGRHGGDLTPLAGIYTGIRAGEVVGSQSVYFEGFGAVGDPMDCRVKYLASLETCGAAERSPCVSDEVGSLGSSDAMLSSSMPGHSLVRVPESQQFAECASPPSYQTDIHGRASRSLSVSHDPVAAPSALVSRLFPALRKVGEQRKKMPFGSQTNSDSLLPPPPPESRNSGAVNTPSPAFSAGGESGFRSLSSSSAIIGEELRQKLIQLEEEIERYRTENASLARLRKEREESLAHLRGEIAEFKKQKREELLTFEEYKKEEMRSLKKERKVFEMYKIEALAARDRKDKEDIENLRNELMAVREDLKVRESRWGSTLSRYRLKIERQESENRELQADVRMMEQERLRMWQMQVEQDAQAKRKPTRQEVCRGADLVEPGREKKRINRKSVLKDKTVDTKRTLWSEKRVKLASTPTASQTMALQPNNAKHIASVWTAEKQVKRMSEPGQSGTAQKTDNSKRCDNGGRETESNPTESKPKDISRLADEIMLQVMEEDGSGEEKERGVLVSHDLERGMSFPSGIKQLKPKENIRPSPQRKPSPSKKSSLSPVKSGGDLSTPSSSSVGCQQQTELPQLGKTEVVEPDGSKVITFSNGTRKVVGADGKSCSVYFFNGDVKHVKPDQTVVYCYSEFNVTQTNYPDGMEVVEFPDHQCEKHYPNGTKEIHFPDNTIKYLYSNGEEESIFPDGLSQRTCPNGDVSLHMPNGIKEFYTAKFKRREYPDGTVKIVYPDGKQETQYASGRVKIKSQTGNILVDNTNKILC